MGHSLGNVLEVLLRCPQADSSSYLPTKILSFVKDSCRLFGYPLRSSLKAASLWGVVPNYLHLQPRPFLLGNSHHRVMHHKVLLQLIDYLDPRQCSVYCYHSNLPRYLPKSCQIIVLSKKPAACFQNHWRDLQYLCSKLSALSVVLSRPGLMAYLPTILHHLQHSLLLYGVAEKIIQGCQPKILLVENDHSVVDGAFVAAARQNNILSVTAIHGVMHHLTPWLPLAADIALCWGKTTYEALKKLGIPSKRLLVTGCPYIEKSLKPASLCLSTSAARFTVAWPLQPAHKQLWLFDLLTEALEKLDTIQCQIRLHPAEKESTVLWLQKQIKNQSQSHLKNITIHRSQDKAIATALGESRWLLCEDSTIALEALLANIQPVVLSSAKGFGRRLIQQAGCLEIASAKQLAHYLKTSHQQPQVLDKKAKIFIKNYLKFTGKQSIQKMAQSLQKLY